MNEIGHITTGTVIKVTKGNMRKPLYERLYAYKSNNLGGYPLINVLESTNYPYSANMK